MYSTYKKFLKGSVSLKKKRKIVTYLNICVGMTVSWELTLPRKRRLGSGFLVIAKFQSDYINNKKQKSKK